MSNTVTFTYPAGPNEVIVTGDFDLWRQSLPLVKQIDGAFSLTMPIPVKSLRDGNRLYFKYVVDGKWTISSDYPKASSSEDSSIFNNYIEIDEESKRASSFIPESVLPMSSSSSNLNKQSKRKMKIKRKIRKNKKTGEKTILSEETEIYDGNIGSDGSGTVTEQEMSTKENTPVEKAKPTPTTTTEAAAADDDDDDEGDAVVDKTPQHDTFAEAAKAKESLQEEPVFTVQPIVPEVEKAKPLAGETGPVIPKDADNIKEFNEVRNVDQEELNTRLNNELKEKEELSKEKEIKNEAVAAPAAIGKMTSLAGELGPVIPENAKDIKEFSEIRDEDKKPNSTETKYASLAGEPGPVIPENPSEIKEFNEIRKEADAAQTETATKTVPTEENQEFHIQPIVPEVEKAQPLVGEPGPVIPEDAANIKEFNEVRDVDQEELNTRLNKELKDKEDAVEVPKKTEAVAPAPKKTETTTAAPKPTATTTKVAKPAPKPKVAAKKPVPAAAQKKDKSGCCVIC
ncbi:hypothetical protein ACO0QE_001011 [Hanseniaspora vineae]